MPHWSSAVYWLLIKFDWFTISSDLFLYLHCTNVCRFGFFLLSLLFLVTDLCSSFNKRVKIALLVLTLQAKHLMHILPKALLKWHLFMSTESNLTNRMSPLCICHFDSMLSLAQNLISFCFVLLLLKAVTILPLCVKED